ncbi:eukaryotic-like serine/threonine-protein kinase [Microdochium nivale]|nr:eukaryotic-like serine/threonine-protein kinase [Microdochium nivale]
MDTIQTMQPSVVGDDIEALRRQFDEQLQNARWPCSDRHEDFIPDSGYRQFMNMPALTRWMTTTEPGHQKTNIARLVGPLDLKLTPFRTGHLDRDHRQSCLCLLSCLFSIGAPELLEPLDLEDIRDSTMDEEISLDVRKRITERVRRKIKGRPHEQTTDHAFAESSDELYARSIKALDYFYERRWDFKPKLLDDAFANNGYSLALGNNVMPFCARREVNHKGGTAKVYQVIVPAEFVSDSIKKHITPWSSHEPYGKCYSLAIKTYTPECKVIFERERAAYMGLQDHEGVIRCFGSYSSPKPSPDVRNEYNLILEYGNSDLHDMYRWKDPPQLPDAIISSWEAIFEVSKTLCNIHRFEINGKAYRGWHADVKPDNILVVQEGGVDKFKLADFGFTEFKECAQDDESQQTTILRGWTRAFGAPEAGKLNVQSMDVWSFGCVLSVHATWIVRGGRGVRAFEGYRNRAKEDLAMEHSAFHDNKTVLPVVSKWHRDLVRDKRGSDSMTASVLDLVDKRMLRIESERVDSAQLCIELQDLVRRAKTVSVTDSMYMDPHFRLQDALEATETIYRSRTGSLSLRVGGGVPDQQLLAASGPSAQPQAGAPLRDREASVAHALRYPQTSSPATEPTSSAAISYSPQVSGTSGVANSVPVALPLTRDKAEELIWAVVEEKNNNVSASEITQLLRIDHPGLLDIRDERLRTPAMKAASLPLKNLDLLGQIVCEADFSLRDAEEQNVVHHLAKGLLKCRSLTESQTRQILSRIEQTPAVRCAANAVGYDGNPPLYLPTFYKNHRVVRLMLDLGARPEKTLLLNSAKAGADDIVRLFVEREDGVRLEDEDLKGHWKTLTRSTKTILKEHGMRRPGRQ